LFSWSCLTGQLFFLQALFLYPRAFQAMLRNNTYRAMGFLRRIFTLNNPVKQGVSPLETALPAGVILHHQTNNTNPQKTKAMKTTKIISALSLVLVFAAGSLFANRINDPGSADKQKLITYEVIVNFTANFPGALSHFMIVITDGTGRKVVPAQAYHPGVSTYTFKEAGTLRGTRIAVMVPYPANTSGWVVPPCVKKGTFVGGATYNFELTPLPNEKNGKNEF
jgi:hypothetical protein